MLNELVATISNDSLPHGWKIDTDPPKGRCLYLGDLNRRVAYSLVVGGGSLILTTNSAWQFTSLELGVPRRYWQLAAPELQHPQPAIQGTLALPYFNARAHEHDEIEPAVCSDHSLSFVNIMIDANYGPGALWVQICDMCFTNISDGHLVGFWIDLSP